MNKVTNLYGELIQTSKEILEYYDIDKIKPYTVYVWTKGDTGKNVFDILEDKIVFYEEHNIIEKAKPTIKKIQLKLKEIRKQSEDVGKCRGR